ncbi:swirm [Purpureocillium lavendulum]|uniref:Swirm n=1 Tax=Purpureocillium lavendulum TaxID=1247861 RepID=A0AB34FJZ9_9HYPO|nr:swirm [Purpureocillium lavendulum]
MQLTHLSTLAMAVLAQAADQVRFPATGDISIVFPRNRTYGVAAPFPIILGLRNSPVLLSFSTELYWAVDCTNRTLFGRGQLKGDNELPPLADPFFYINATDALADKYGDGNSFPSWRDGDKDECALAWEFSPSLITLSHRINCLKVDWNGRPLDLGDDPHGYLLHPEEVTLASTLRLDCATYLTSKRRIVQRRLECLRIGKEFRKTDAQKACKIDVNKVSKMWTAFKTVGWLDESFMRQFL